MTDETKNENGENTNTQTDATEAANLAEALAELAKLKKRNADLVKEAGDSRIEAKEAKKKLAETSQDWKAIAEAAETEKAEIAPKAAKADEYLEVLNKTVESRIKAIPESLRSIVPDFGDPVKTLKWLEDNAGKLALPKPPPYDAGAGGTAKNAVPELKDLEKFAAAKLGVTAEQYTKYKSVSGANAASAKETPEPSKDKE